MTEGVGTVGEEEHELRKNAKKLTPSLNGRRWCQATARRGLVAGGGKLRRRPYTMRESDR
jgi:hypothetical protein